MGLGVVRLALPVANLLEERVVLEEAVCEALRGTEEGGGEALITEGMESAC